MHLNDNTIAAPTEVPGGPRSFDFWLGSWDVIWENGRGTNEVLAILDDHVILERFDGRPGAELRGMSISVHDAAVDRWRQTWVDNSGGYLEFSGRLDAGLMILERPAGPRVLQRMVWFDIAADSLRWNWERSTDGGRSWEVQWALAYRRRSADPSRPRRTVAGRDTDV